jgi:hypothetical protein
MGRPSSAAFHSSASAGWAMLQCVIERWTSFDLVRGYGPSGRANLQHGAEAFVAMAVLRAAAQVARAEDVAGGADRVGQWRAHALIGL